MEDLIGLIFLVVIVAIGFFAGTFNEKRHYADIKKRERQTLHLPCVNFGAKQALPPANEAHVFVGCVVVANDAFKTFMGGLINIFGGRITVYESLLDRGRREAMLRMKEEAIAWGATQIFNVRYETSDINSQQGDQGAPIIEIMVYGTGIK
ncbi:protein of unknown function DUF74 [Thalassoporum mexicanum PCC 7367]|uniref:YbjQ family protein n=1 Tax=Thalassoporum mexicanum TaxID=3457544 RepID=UPI00029FA685|nr:heavy metal-binding domain-containing protein [Pseudanabaena sp. PCC 7367]AFY69483.1 protein of unknown function DUF74 [Pseudanabaena sp. PCC 7367]